LARALQRVNNNFFSNVKNYEEYREYIKCLGSDSNVRPNALLDMAAKPISLGLAA